MAGATVMNMLAFCSFITALILGLVGYVGSGNAPWTRLNNDGRTVIVGGLICTIAGVVTFALSILEHYGYIQIVVI